MKKLSIVLIALTTLPFSISKADNQTIAGGLTAVALVGGSIYWYCTTRNSQDTTHSDENSPTNTAADQDNKKALNQHLSDQGNGSKQQDNNPEATSQKPSVITPQKQTPPTTKLSGVNQPVVNKVKPAVTAPAPTESTIYLDILKQSLKNMNTKRFFREENATF